MDLRFIGQPFSTDSSLFDFFGLLASGKYDRLRIATAWAKRSGLARVRKDIDAFRKNGGHVSILLGVSEGGATKEGLELAYEMSDECFVLHDPRRTFHPKVYFAEGEQTSLIVGSSNLTAGGLGWNFESSLWVDFEIGETSALIDDVAEWFDRLKSDSRMCVPLTPELIDKLLLSKDMFIGEESVGRRVSRGKDSLPEDNDSSETSSVEGLFLGTDQELISLPKLSGPAAKLVRKNLRKQEVDDDGLPLSGRDPIPIGDAGVIRRWYRRMNFTQAQQTRSPNTNPKGSMTLSRSGSDFDHTTYFRDFFFRGLPWSPSSAKLSKEEVQVAFSVWVDGNDLGVHDLKLSHDLSRVSDQGNVPTWLHWNTLLPTLKKTSYVDFYCTLERLENGRFRLFISREPIGEYIF